MIEIEEFLGRLKELDPETFDEWRYVYRGNWEGAEYSGVKLERTDLWLLQGVIQEAIVARGWIFSLDRVNGHYTAYIWDERDREMGAGSRDTPAEALLRAYITALEAAEVLLRAYIVALETES